MDLISARVRDASDSIAARTSAAGWSRPKQLDNPVASTIVLADRVLDRALRRTE
ncbi:hypothetical protein [Nocardia sp. NPDC058497]|uniref:hypothetical protein n=1 Tax=Nocardia sp. NPDC058497 TaxID=3346529 RepID=UPI0036661AF6